MTTQNALDLQNATTTIPVVGSGIDYSGVQGQQRACGRGAMQLQPQASLPHHRCRNRHAVPCDLLQHQALMLTHVICSIPGLTPCRNRWSQPVMLSRLHQINKPVMIWSHARCAARVKAVVPDARLHGGLQLLHRHSLPRLLVWRAPRGACCWLRACCWCRSTACGHGQAAAPPLRRRLWLRRRPAALCT